MNWWLAFCGLLLLLCTSLAGQRYAFDVAAFDRDRILKAANSLFNLEAMATICQILSTPEDDLWTFELADGRGMRRGLEFMARYIRHKKSWPLSPDVMYDSDWPMRQSSLLFAGLALGRPQYIKLWKALPADSTVEEVIRNFFIRQPALCVEFSNRSSPRKAYSSLQMCEAEYGVAATCRSFRFDRKAVTSHRTP